MKRFPKVVSASTVAFFFCFLFIFTGANLAHGRTISSLIPVADTAVHEFSESTATDGNNWLVAVRGSSGNADEACAQLMSSNGLKIGSLIQTGRLIHTPTDGDLPPFRAPFVTFGGGKYLMVWVDHASGGKVYGQFISKAGTLVGSAFAISSDGDKYLPDVASDGIDFFVIWTDWGGTEGRFVSSSGVLGSQVEISFANDIASVAYGGGQYLVGWMTSSDGNSLPQCRLVSSDGTMGSTLTLGSSSLYYENMNIAYGDGRFMTAWSHTGGNIDLKGRMVLPNGTLVGSELDLVSDALNEMSVGHCLAHDGDYFLLAWVASDFGVGVDDISYGQYVDSDGNMLGSPFVIDSTPDTGSAIDFVTGVSAFQGKALTLITTDAFGSGGNVYAVMIDSAPWSKLQHMSSGQLQLDFNGILASTTNLVSGVWNEISPQPTNPWVFSPIEDAMCFRARRLEDTPVLTTTFTKSPRDLGDPENVFTVNADGSDTWVAGGSTGLPTTGDLLAYASGSFTWTWTAEYGGIDSGITNGWDETTFVGVTGNGWKYNGTSYTFGPDTPLDTTINTIQGEAIRMKFDLSNLNLSPGFSLRLKSLQLQNDNTGPGRVSFKDVSSGTIMQLTGTGAGKIAPAIGNDVTQMVSQTVEDGDEIALWRAIYGGGQLRLKGFTFEVVP